MLVFAAASCGGSTVGTPSSPSLVPTTARPSPAAVAVISAGPPPSPFAPGTCTRAGIENELLIRRWLELAGKHDIAAVRDCFAASYGVPDAIVDRWANLGGPSRSTTEHVMNAVSNGCDRFSVSATFPNGNPYAGVQGPNDMFLVVGVGMDGDRPRIFGTATAAVRQSPDVTPHTGPPDCR